MEAEFLQIAPEGAPAAVAAEESLPPNRQMRRKAQHKAKVEHSRAARRRNERRMRRARR